jgi:hypothetical protein
VVCIGLAQDGDRQRALVNMETTFWFNKMLGSSRVAAQLVPSQEVFSYLNLVSCLVKLVSHSTSEAEHKNKFTPQYSYLKFLLEAMHFNRN